MLTINLDTNSSVPLYEQIYAFIKKEIQNGHMNYQQKLPSTRSLAEHLQISRNTVDMSYSQLLSEGYIESIPKKGYYVCQMKELTKISTEQKTAPVHSKVVLEHYLYDFSPFSIDVNQVPFHTWRKLSKNCMNNNSLFLLGDKQGDYELRAAIHKYLHDSRGVNCSPDEILIGAGADYLLQLLSQIISEKSIIAMENPTYKQAYHIFRGLKIKTIGIPLDNLGMSLEALRSSDANIAYVTPSHQYPLGIVMPIQRRLELLAWANGGDNRYIIEDDHDSEFRYKGKPIPSLQGIDSNHKVIYLGTFSRAIAPAIRIGYMVLPPQLLKVYKERYSYYSSTVSRIDQAIMASFIKDGYFERHLNRMRKIYKNKHDVLMNAFKGFGSTVKIHGENAGLHVVVEFLTDLSEDDIIQRAEKHRIKLYGLSKHFIGESTVQNPHILFGYANLSEKEIIQGVHLIYQIIDC